MGKVLLCFRPPVVLSGVREVDARVPLECYACGLLMGEIVGNVPPHTAQGTCPLFATTSKSWIVTSQRRAWQAEKHYFAEMEWVNMDCQSGRSPGSETARC